jgi:hypothetical protein
MDRKALLAMAALDSLLACSVAFGCRYCHGKIGLKWEGETDHQAALTGT